MGPETDVWTEAGLHAWLEAHRPDMTRFLADPADSLEDRIDRTGRLLGYLDSQGVSGWGWPVELGGKGGTAVHRAIYYEAMSLFGYGMPENVAALEVLGSALIRFAPHIAAEMLPAMLDGSALWCQGFSEPEAGSDLASLRTTAKKVDGGWSITGQKVWTSLAHRANWCGVLARTGAPDSRHRGLTLFWLDMTADGVDARPLRALTGEDDFSELFLDGAFVPDDRVIGEVDDGWAIAMYLLQFERGMWAWQRQAIMHGMMQDAIAHSPEPELHLDSIGRAYLSLSAVRTVCRLTVERLARGETLGPEVSADKVLLGQTEHLVNDVVRELAPAFETSDDPRTRDERREWFYSRAATVYGGAVDIQKNILATRILNLPQAARRG